MIEYKWRTPHARLSTPTVLSGDSTTFDRWVRWLSVGAVASALLAAVAYAYVQSKPQSLSFGGSLVMCADRRAACMGVRGIYNDGNTCFTNALVQALAASRTFQSWLTEVDDTDGLTHALRVLVDSVNGVGNTNDDADDAQFVSSAPVIGILRARGWRIERMVEQVCARDRSVPSHLGFIRTAQCIRYRTR
jgi:hypothetical protein